jgi:hypothetical protein
LRQIRELTKLSSYSAPHVLELLAEAADSDGLLNVSALYRCLVMMNRMVAPDEQGGVQAQLKHFAINFFSMFDEVMGAADGVERRIDFTEVGCAFTILCEGKSEEKVSSNPLRPSACGAGGVRGVSPRLPPIKAADSGSLLLPQRRARLLLSRALACSLLPPAVRVAPLTPPPLPPPSPPPPQVKAAFGLFDVDSDGFIELEEMAILMKSMFTMMSFCNAGLFEKLDTTPGEMAEQTALEAFETLGLKPGVDQMGLQAFVDWYKSGEGGGSLGGSGGYGADEESGMEDEEVRKEASARSKPQNVLLLLERASERAAASRASLKNVLLLLERAPERAAASRLAHARSKPQNVLLLLGSRALAQSPRTCYYFSARTRSLKAPELLLLLGSCPPPT